MSALRNFLKDFVKTVVEKVDDVKEEVTDTFNNALGIEPEFNPSDEDKQPTLRLGDQSEDGWVEYLQQLLNAHAADSLVVDGDFGQATLKAVLEFQKAAKAKDPEFAVDGIVGNQTWAALRLGSPEAPDTDQREPHTFVDRGAKARWFWDNGVAFYNEGIDELHLHLISVGDNPDLEGEKVYVFVTAPGSRRKREVVKIGPHRVVPNYQITIADIAKKFPSLPEDAKVENYLVEAYFDKALGGDLWSTKKGGEILVYRDSGDEDDNSSTDERGKKNNVAYFEKYDKVVVFLYSGGGNPIVHEGQKVYYFITPPGSRTYKEGIYISVSRWERRRPVRPCINSVCIFSRRRTHPCPWAPTWKITICRFTLPVRAPSSTSRRPTVRSFSSVQIEVVESAESTKPTLT